MPVLPSYVGGKNQVTHAPIHGSVTCIRMTSEGVRSFSHARTIALFDRGCILSGMTSQTKDCESLHILREGPSSSRRPRMLSEHRSVIISASNAKLLSPYLSSFVQKIPSINGTKNYCCIHPQTQYTMSTSSLDRNLAVSGPILTCSGRVAVIKILIWAMYINPICTKVQYVLRLSMCCAAFYIRTKHY